MARFELSHDLHRPDVAITSVAERYRSASEQVESGLKRIVVI